MSMAVAPIMWLIPVGAPTMGVSPAAEAIADKTAQRRERDWASHTLGYADVELDLLRLAQEAAAANWDGYGAVLVSPESVNTAIRVLRSLPLGTPRPTAGIEPDGCVTLEWHRSPLRTLSISAGPDGVLHYASLLGPLAHQSGALPFLWQLPRELLELIRRVSAG